MTMRRVAWQWCGLPCAGLMISGMAWGLEPVEFENGAVLDVSTHLSWINMKRLSGPAPLLAHPSDSNAINSDDGNRTVGRHGTISNRLGAVVDINLAKDEYRAFVRFSSLYDAAMDRENANGSLATFNGTGAAHHYSTEVRKLVGGRTRLLDAYAQGRWKLNEDAAYPLTVRVGRQVLAWGEGLYFTGIGGSMNPQDGYKAQIPGTPIKEMFLPSEQVSATLGLGRQTMLMAYAKWAFRETEVPPVGSYFSYSDIVGPGGNFMRFMPGVAGPGAGMLGAWRAPDVGRDSGGQWGLAVKHQLTDETDVGLYHLRYRELLGLPEFSHTGNFWQLGEGPVSLPFLSNLAPSSYHLRYMGDIRLTGASFSTRLGEANVAGEVAYREGAPVLMSDIHYGLARAKVLNTQISAIRLWSSEFLGGMLGVDTAQLSGEVAASTVNSFSTPASSGVPNGPAALLYDKNSLAYAFGLTLKYIAVAPGWDMAVPMDWSHQLKGNPGMQGWNSGLQGENDRRLSLGVTLTYQQNLELGLKLAHFLGKADFSASSLRTLVDRDFLAMIATYRF